MLHAPQAALQRWPALLMEAGSSFTIAASNLEFALGACFQEHTSISGGFSGVSRRSGALCPSLPADCFHNPLWVFYFYFFKGEGELLIWAHQRRSRGGAHPFKTVSDGPKGVESEPA